MPLTGAIEGTFGSEHTRARNIGSERIAGAALDRRPSEALPTVANTGLPMRAPSASTACCYVASLQHFHATMRGPTQMRHGTRKRRGAACRKLL